MSSIAARITAVGELELAPGGACVPLAAPSSVEEARELVTMAARDRLRVLPLGLGSKLGWCRPPQRADLALSTRALSGLVAYEPGDGTITALAGTRMSALARAVRAGGHRLTPDVPRPDAATLGGVLAAGQSGSDRLRFGPMRHHVLGTRVLLANGELTKSGGRLVKNVTGYDLHRLYCGSHGTLGLIVEATLRLFPLPETAALASADFARFDGALEAAGRVLASEARPTSLSIARGIDGARAWRLRALFDGRAEVVEWQRGLVAPLVPEAGWNADADAWALAARERDALPGADGAPALRASCRPSRLAAVARALFEALDARGLEPEAVLLPGVASCDVALGALAPGALAPLVRELRAGLAARVELRHADWNAAGELDPFGEPGPGLALMHRLRRRLDPEGRFASGRFHGGL